MMLAWCSGCTNEPAPEPPLEPIGGRDPESLITVSGENWFPENIGIVYWPEGRTIHIQAISGATKAGSIQLELTVEDENMRNPDFGPLNYWEIVFPVTIDLSYEIFFGDSGDTSHKWLAFHPDRGGIRIDDFEEEDGVTYARGEFHMTPGNDGLNPPVHYMTGVFNNVRVFPSIRKMREYFDHVNALILAAED